MLLGEELIPSSFNIYGEPKFTEEQQFIYTFKQGEIRRNIGNYNYILEVEITYEKKFLDKPRESFDTSGKIRSFWRTNFGKVISNGNVELYEDFIKNNERFSSIIGASIIPDFDLICPYCNKKNTIKDIKNNSYVYVNENLYHETCANNYIEFYESYASMIEIIE